MNSRSKKILIIVIITILVLAIVGATFAYLFIATDTFKSDKELFAKYMKQNKEVFNEILDSSIYTTLENTKEQDTYESDTTINTSYSEGGEISNPINELSFKIKTQKENNYRYRNAQILFEDTGYLGIEGIRENEIYGIRFTNAMKEFISIRDSGNLEQEANNIGMDLETLEKCISVINNDESLINEILTKEEQKYLIEKYIGIITDNINNASFSKQKGAMITFNNSTIKTNAYMASLDSNQVQNLILQLLNNIKQESIVVNIIGEENESKFIEKIDNIIDNLGIDTEIPTIRITTYEQKGITIRTVFEIGLEKITIENSNQNGQTKTKIQRNVLNNEQQEEQNIEITKIKNEAQESYNIIANIIEGENSYLIEFNVQITSNNGILTTVGNIKFTEGIIKIELAIENIINTTQIQDKIDINQNNVILSDLDKETRERVLNIVKTGVPEILTNRANELIEKLQIQQLIQKAMSGIIENIPNEENPVEPAEQNPTETEEPQMSQIEINKFNAKFEFYTGETVSAENVKILLDVVKTNLNSIEIIPIETTGEEESNEENKKENIKLIIEKDKENVELANQVLAKIEDGKKYKVSITYKNTNDIIDYITISEITD